MSVINRVIDQLDRRGEREAIARQMATPVAHPAVRRPAFMYWMAGGVVLALAAAAAFWLTSRAQREAPRRPVAAVAPVRAIAPAVIMPVRAPEIDGTPELPASRLSYELSRLPTSVAPRKPGEGRKADAVSSPAAAAVAASEPPVPMKQISRGQQAEAEFRKGVEAMRQGRVGEAQAGYRAALRIAPEYDTARQALVALLVEERHTDEAEEVLRERLDSKPDHATFAMLQARLQVERGAVLEALVTLERTLPFAEANAPYRAFFAALLQRANRHVEAVEQYRAALRLQPGNGSWLMGCGLSLQALQRNDEALAAFRQAQDSKMLSAELLGFVQQRIRALSAR